MPPRVAKFVKINVAANPHPQGVYHKIFVHAAERDGQAYGRNWLAKIAKPTPVEDGFFHGRLGVWHELKGKAIQTSSLERRDLATLLNDEADGFGFPSKVFSFTFRERDHLLFCEIKNDERDQISPGSLGSALRAVLEKAAKELDIDLSVTVLPESSSVEQIFELDTVTKISVDFSLPNAGDHLSKEKSRIIERLKRRGVNRQKIEYRKAKSAESIEFDSDLKAEVEVGAENGTVVAAGTDNDGNKKVIDTTQRPIIVQVPMASEDSSVGVLRGLARGD
jgi:Domain of unknown function (DUF4747)